MSNISEIFSPPTANTPETKAADKTADIMGKEDFLTLLVAQLKNQDPLNPDDATQFTSQLTEFSSLEQLQNLNGGMEDLAMAQQQSERLGAMDLIGKEIVYPSGDFFFDGSKTEIGYQLDGAASSVTMYIQNQDGAVINTLDPTELSMGNHFLTWDGTDSEGNQVADGKYKIILHANAGGEDSTVAISPLVRAEVTGLVMDSETGAAILQTPGGQVNITDIIAAYKMEAQISNQDDEEETAETESADDTESAADSIADVTGAAGIAAPSGSTESAPTDEGQITQDILSYHLSG